jgi:hypothetical protein
LDRVPLTVSQPTAVAMIDVRPVWAAACSIKFDGLTQQESVVSQQGSGNDLKFFGPSHLKTHQTALFSEEIHVFEPKT